MICIICQEEFEEKTQGLKEICRKETCRDKYKKLNREPNVVCALCGKQFYLKPSSITGTNCCSRKCMGELRKIIYKGELNPNFGRRDTKSKLFKGYIKVKKYVWIYCPEHPYNVDGYVLEHRLVAEKYLLNDSNSIIIDGKRYLRRDLVVHHIDFNKHNNHKDNLLILTKSEHTRLHNLAEPQERSPQTGRFI